MTKSMASKLIRALGLLALLGAGGAAAGAGVSSAPSIFAPGSISGGAHDAAPTMTPDGQRLFFSRSNSTGASIMESFCAGGHWQPPKVASFSGEWNDLEPVMSPGGSFLLFVSSRPAADGAPPLDGFFNGKTAPGLGGNLWRIDRIGASWGSPRRLPAIINDGPNIFAPALRADGELSFMKPDRATGRFRLYHAVPHGAGYADPVAYPFSTGAFTDVDPAIAPDGSFLIFGSSRPPAKGIDLFIALRGRHGGWQKPVHLGDVVNTPGSDAEPRLSPDGSTLYFSSERTVAPAFPRSREVARTTMLDIDQWDNGLYNIWQVPVAGLLKKAGSPADEDRG